MEKGYYWNTDEFNAVYGKTVAIHNKNGKGLLHKYAILQKQLKKIVAIHNKNGKGLLQKREHKAEKASKESQSTIKMEKGYYRTYAKR